MAPRSPVPNVPLIPGSQFTPVQDNTGRAIAGLGQAITGVGRQASQVAAKRQAVADSTEATLSFLKGADDINSFNRDLSFSPDPEKHAEKFGAGFDQIVKKLIGSASNGRVQRMLTERFAQFRLGRIDQARAKQNEVFVRDKRARIDSAEEDLTREAALLFTEERINTDPGTGVSELIEQPTDVGLLTEKLSDFTNLILGLDGSVYARGEGERRAIAAQQRVLSARVRSEIRDDPNIFLENISKDKVLIGTPGNQIDISDILPQEEIESLSNFARQTREKIRIQEARVESNNDKQFTKIKAVFKRDFISRAISRTLPAHILQQIAEDKFPYLSPNFALTLQRILDNPIIGGDNQNVLAHMTDYHAGPSTLERIGNARDALNLMRENDGTQGKAMDDALDELQSDEVRLTSIEATRINRSSTIAVRQYKNIVGKSIFGGITGKMSDNRIRLNLAEIERRVRSGEDGATVVKDIIDRDNQKARSSIPPKDREVMEALQQGLNEDRDGN